MRKFKVSPEIVRIIREHPKGITSIRIIEILEERYGKPNVPDYIPVVLCKLTNQGILKRVEKPPCGECGLHFTINRT